MKKKRGKTIWETGKKNILQMLFSRTMLIMFLIVLQFAYIVARIYALTEHIPLIVGSEYMVVAFMMIVILNSEENSSVKLSWCCLVGIFPLLGSVVYFIVKYDFGYRMVQKRVSFIEKESRKSLPEQSQLMNELKEKDMQTYRICCYLNRTSGSLVSKNNEIKYFPLGDIMYEEMLKQMEKAEEYIFLEYFMIAHGEMWNKILRILEKKAKDGVEVRILYDGTCSVYLLPYQYPKEIEKLGIKCRMFSPPIPFVSTHYNNRDHRKIMIIDGKTVFTGGINLCDEYININSPVGHWKDVGIMIQGDAVYSFIMMFLQMWYATDQKKYKTNKVQFPTVENAIKTDSKLNKEQANRVGIRGKGYVIPYSDSPLDKENVCENVYMDILNQAKKYVYIMTPYLILDGEMMTAITFAAKRGVDIRIMLPHIPDKWYAFVLARANYKILLEAGVKLYEYIPGFVHAKVFVADDERAVVGTANLDFRSLYWHYECSVYLYQVNEIKEIVKDFEETQKLCQQITEEVVKKIGIFSKVSAYILKIVASLM